MCLQFGGNALTRIDLFNKIPFKHVAQAVSTYILFVSPTPSVKIRCMCNFNINSHIEKKITVANLRTHVSLFGICVDL